MRYSIPIGILIVLAAAYSVFWYMAAGRIETGFHDWAERQREGGAEVAYTQARVSGYPFRLELRVTDPRFARTNVGGSIAWTGGAVTATVLPYRLSHVSLALEGGQDITIRTTEQGAEETVHIGGKAESARASLVWTGGLFDRVSIDVKGFDGTRETTAGTEPTHRQTIRAERIRLQSTGSDKLEDLKPDGLTGQPAVEDKGLRARRVAIRMENAHWNNHGIGRLGEAIALAEASVVFSRVPEALVREHGPFADETLRAWQLAGGKARLEALRVDWAPLNAAAHGTLGLDGRGHPQGEIDVATRDPVGVTNALEEGDLLDKVVADAVRGALRIYMAVESVAGDGTMTVPVVFKNQGAYIARIRVTDTRPWFE